MAVSSVGEMTVTSVATIAGNLPFVRFTDVAPATNPVPTTVTVVPPLTGPLAGETEETVGVGSTWTEPASQDVSAKFVSPRWSTVGHKVTLEPLTLAVVGSGIRLRAGLPLSGSTVSVVP